MNPIQVTCRLCGHEITLPPDSIEARKKKTDPLHVLHLHIMAHFMTLFPLLTQRGIGNFLDTLCFSSPDARWHASQQKLFDWVRTEEALKSEAERTSIPWL